MPLYNSLELLESRALLAGSNDAQSDEIELTPTEASSSIPMVTQWLGNYGGWATTAAMLVNQMLSPSFQTALKAHDWGTAIQLTTIPPLLAGTLSHAITAPIGLITDALQALSSQTEKTFSDIPAAIISCVHPVSIGLLTVGSFISYKVGDLYQPTTISTKGLLFEKAIMPLISRVPTISKWLGDHTQNDMLSISRIINVPLPSTLASALPSVANYLPNGVPVPTLGVIGFVAGSYLPMDLPSLAGATVGTFMGYYSYIKASTESTPAGLNALAGSLKAPFLGFIAGGMLGSYTSSMASTAQSWFSSPKTDSLAAASA